MERSSSVPTPRLLVAPLARSCYVGTMRLLTFPSPEWSTALPEERTDGGRHPPSPVGRARREAAPASTPIYPHPADFDSHHNYQPAPLPAPLPAPHSQQAILVIEKIDAMKDLWKRQLRLQRQRLRRCSQWAVRTLLWCRCCFESRRSLTTRRESHLLRNECGPTLQDPEDVWAQ